MADPPGLLSQGDSPDLQLLDAVQGPCVHQITMRVTIRGLAGPKAPLQGMQLRRQVCASFVIPLQPWDDVQAPLSHHASPSGQIVRHIDPSSQASPAEDLAICAGEPNCCANPWAKWLCARVVLMCRMCWRTYEEGVLLGNHQGPRKGGAVEAGHVVHLHSRCRSGAETLCKNALFSIN